MLSMVLQAAARQSLPDAPRRLTAPHPIQQLSLSPHPQGGVPRPSPAHHQRSPAPRLPARRSGARHPTSRRHRASRRLAEPRLPARRAVVRHPTVGVGARERRGRG